MDFVGELLLGFIVRFLRDEGVAVDGVRDYVFPSGSTAESHAAEPKI